MSTVVRISLACIAIWLSLAAPPALADTRSAMADAMVRMMEAMGLFGTAGGAMSGGSPGVPNPMGMSGWPSGFGAMPGVPGAGTMPFPGSSQMDPTAQMGQMGQMLERFNPGSAMTGAMPWTASPLEGIWEGSDDGLLIVQGGRYRIYAPFSGYIDGDMRITGDRVELTNRREGFSQEFEYALDQGRLVLRDRQGQIYLYRRLVLEGG
ncbi:hypothetical protein [Thiocapsa marina]|uniref:Uncharacterized protein n=1 Tax=Thiocapsa marina 5811 TaxID=768671 RepID=F9UB25_9GAMM|nr:hypothetical protein [Thiocapsa marina]EGV18643.1 hypothetical protein ThimaDRAFT_2061 [Thiocapsa marina 5811]